MTRIRPVGDHARIVGTRLGLLAIMFFQGSLYAQPATPRSPEEAQPATIPPTLTVAGEGESSTRPDRAVIQLGAVAQAEQASAAQAQVNAVMQAAIDAIRKVDIADEMISTAGISLQPVYTDRQALPRDEQPSAEPRITGYRASKRVRVVIDDLSKVGDVIDAGVQAGANQVQGLSFELKDDTAARRTALADAARQARAKADALASALDLRIDSVHAVNEGGVNVMRPRMDFARAGVAAMEMSTPVQPGQVDVQASVTIVYRVSPALSR